MPSVPARIPTETTDSDKLNIRIYKHQDFAWPYLWGLRWEGRLIMCNLQGERAPGLVRIQS